VFDHVTIRVSDRAASERFYDTVLPAIGIRRTSFDEHYTEWDDFSIVEARTGHPVTLRLHIGFRAPTYELVEAFWRDGVDAGYADDGSPGARPVYGDDYFGGFLLDPDGNSAEASLHDNLRKERAIDHLWIRVADVAASKAFYEQVGRHAGFGIVAERPELVRFRGATGGSFSVVAGAPSQNVHMAFPTAENTTVDAFHADLVSAGYRDNGEPGERPVYHEGYYGAFVLDPDGNNIEIVNHNR
jgi:catechol 2,3-dioxygenase-like lactoylglutathione lyase family enzyme